MRSLIILLLMLPLFAVAQNTGKTVQQKIFDGKATIKLPAGYVVAKNVVVIDQEKYQRLTTSYTNTAAKHSVWGTMDKNPQEPDNFKSGYEELKSTFNLEYLDVLRDEFVTEGGKVYYSFECKLKPEYYNVEKGMLEMSNGTIYPNHFVYHATMVNGRVALLCIDYKGDEEGLQDIREKNGAIISSFKVLF